MSARAVRIRPADIRKPRDTQVGDSGLVEAVPLSPHVDIPPWVLMAVRRYVLSIKGMRRPRPKWVSQEVFQEVIQEVIQKKLVVVQQLATDPSMRKVWRTLERRRPFDDCAICEFIEYACATDIHNLSVNDRAKMIEFASSVADACRDLIKAPRVSNDPTLSAAFALVAEFFEKDALKAERIDPGSLVKHRGKNDQARAYVRMLGQLTQRLFGATLYRTVATVATVALGRPIGWQQVRNWCSTKPGKDLN